MLLVLYLMSNPKMEVKHMLIEDTKDKTTKETLIKELTTNGDYANDIKTILKLMEKLDYDDSDISSWFINIKRLLSESYEEKSSKIDEIFKIKIDELNKELNKYQLIKSKIEVTEKEFKEQCRVKFRGLIHSQRKELIDKIRDDRYNIYKNYSKDIFERFIDSLNQILKDNKNLSIIDIKDIVNDSVNTIKNETQKIKKELKSELKKDYNDRYIDLEEFYDDLSKIKQKLKDDSDSKSQKLNDLIKKVDERRSFVNFILKDDNVYQTDNTLDNTEKCTFNIFDRYSNFFSYW